MITIPMIQQRVADRYNLRLADLTSSERTRRVSHPRQVAMYLAKRLTWFGRPTIGNRFGGRDPSTVLHAVRAVETRRAADPAFDHDLCLLSLDLLAPHAEEPDGYTRIAGALIRVDALPLDIFRRAA